MWGKTLRMNSENGQMTDEIFREMAIRVANHYDISCAKCWEDLPRPFRELIVNISYKSLIVPLVLCDRESGQTWQQLAIKYRVSVQTIRTILAKRR